MESAVVTVLTEGFAHYIVPVQAYYKIEPGFYVKLGVGVSQDLKTVRSIVVALSAALSLRCSVEPRNELVQCPKHVPKQYLVVSKVQNTRSHQ